MLNNHPLIELLNHNELNQLITYFEDYPVNMKNPHKDHLQIS